MTNLSYVTPKNDVEKISRELSWKRDLGRALEKFYVRLLKPSEIFTSKKSSPAADVLVIRAKLFLHTLLNARRENQPAARGRGSSTPPAYGT